MIDRKKMEEFKTKLGIKKKSEDVLAIPLQLGMLAFDELENNDFVIYSRDSGYRFTGSIFAKIMRSPVRGLGQIKDMMIEFNVESLLSSGLIAKAAMSTDENRNITYNIDRGKNRLELKILEFKNCIDIKKDDYEIEKLSPKLKHDNLAVDICRTMMFFLIGDKKTINYLSANDILSNMRCDYVFYKS